MWWIKIYHYFTTVRLLCKGLWSKEESYEFHTMNVVVTSAEFLYLFRLFFVPGKDCIPLTLPTIVSWVTFTWL